jgi:hypothetical protein
MTARQRLPNPRLAEHFEIEVGGQHHTVTGRLAGGGMAEVFISDGRAGSESDTAARDSAIVCSLSLENGADIDAIRKALCRDFQARASGPVDAALDVIAEGAAP